MRGSSWTSPTCFLTPAAGAKRTAMDQPPMYHRVWAQAFGIYQGIRLEAHPEEAIGMAKYSSDIAAFSAPNPGTPPGDFYCYDVRFRKHRAALIAAKRSLKGYGWGCLRNDLWLSATMEAAKQERPQASRGAGADKSTRPKGSGGPSGGAGGSSGKADSVCPFFNWDKGCSHSNCSMKHICTRCKLPDHGASVCTKP